MTLELRNVRGRSSLILVAVAMSLLLFAPSAQSQARLGPGSPGASVDPNSPEDLMAEYQQVQERLGRLQAQAIQENEELEARRTQVDGLVTAAMSEINPESEAQIERLSVLSDEMMVAQQAQDSARLQEIMTEAMSIRAELGAAQAAAVGRADVQMEIQSFEEDLMARVVEIDPDAPGLLARLEELTEVLSLGDPG
jgi:predicted nuclease with TOPRIM domain